MSYDKPTLEEIYRWVDINNFTQEQPEFLRIPGLTMYDALYGGFEVGTILVIIGQGIGAVPIYRDANERNCTSLFEAVMWCISEYAETEADEDA